MKTFVTAAASFAMIAIATLSTSVVSQATELKRATRAPSVNSMQITGKPSAVPIDNEAKAWTAACYAEFGPNAKYPDAALLEKCLNF